MRDHTNQDTLHAKTQQLMQGPLKHIKAAALAAALLPLASVAAAPASAQTACASSGFVCGFVFDDTNNNGIQDAGELGIEGVQITIVQGTDTYDIETGPGGLFSFEVPRAPDLTTITTIEVKIPTGTQPSPTDSPNTTETFDSDGTNNGGGFSTVTVDSRDGLATDFGFATARLQGPGTGTPGYWKNHPEAWPQTTITVGGITYTREKAIEWLGKVGKDKTTTLFSSLVSAMLNKLVGNDTSCVDATITAANTWMKAHPVGSGVLASSAAWETGEPLHIILDNYNNGRLCAPHRN